MPLLDQDQLRYLCGPQGNDLFSEEEKVSFFADIFLQIPLYDEKIAHLMEKDLCHLQSLACFVKVTDLEKDALLTFPNSPLMEAMSEFDVVLASPFNPEHDTISYGDLVSRMNDWDRQYPRKELEQQLIHFPVSNDGKISYGCSSRPLTFWYSCIEALHALFPDIDPVWKEFIESGGLLQMEENPLLVSGWSDDEGGSASSCSSESSQDPHSATGDQSDQSFDSFDFVPD